MPNWQEIVEEKTFLDGVGEGIKYTADKAKELSVSAVSWVRNPGDTTE